MKNSPLVAVVLTLLVLVGGIFLLLGRSKKVEIKKFEVWYDRQNAALYNQRADYCQIPKDQRGVPFLFTLEGKCLTEDGPIIDHFKNLKLEAGNNNEKN